LLEIPGLFAGKFVSYNSHCNQIKITIVFLVDVAQMYLRIICVFCTALCLLNSGLAQQSGGVNQELQLDLEQFPETDSETGIQIGNETRTDNLELNLEQFDSADQAEAGLANPDGGLKLNLEQFDNTDDSPSNGLELNLDQFENSDQKSVNVENKPPVAGSELELNLDKFDNNNNSATQIDNTGSRSTEVEKSTAPKYNYLPLFIVVGLVFVVLMVINSRRRKRR